MNNHGSFSEAALRSYQELVTARFAERVQGTEQHETLGSTKPRNTRSPKPGAVQGTETVSAFEELDKDPEFSQPRCPAGQWRNPPQKGICQPKEAVIAQRQDAEKQRLNDALRNRLEKLKKTQQHKAKQEEAEDPVVVNKVVERKSPGIKLEPNTKYGVLTEDGLQVLNSETYDFTAALRG